MHAFQRDQQDALLAKIRTFTTQLVVLKNALRHVLLAPGLKLKQKHALLVKTIAKPALIILIALSVRMAIIYLIMNATKLAQLDIIMIKISRFVLFVIQIANNVLARCNQIALTVIQQKEWYWFFNTNRIRDIAKV